MEETICCWYSAEGEAAANSQAKGPNLDESLESRNAPKKLNLSGKKTERINTGNELAYCEFMRFFVVCAYQLRSENDGIENTVI